MPDLTERLTANVSHRQMEKGAPLPKTSGSLYRPMAQGREVEGGVRKRMKEEDQRRNETGDGR